VKVLDRLVLRGDTLVIVEHHPDVIANADWVVELGPEAGEHGGTVVFEGEAAALRKQKTATGLALRLENKDNPSGLRQRMVALSSGGEARLPK
jgi:excinuclease ABC subunit A